MSPNSSKNFVALSSQDSAIFVDSVDAFVDFFAGEVLTVDSTFSLCNCIIPSINLEANCSKRSFDSALLASFHLSKTNLEISSNSSRLREPALFAGFASLRLKAFLVDLLNHLSFVRLAVILFEFDYPNLQ